MNLENVMKRCGKEEGRTSWMYLDSAKPPNVTAGEGHLIPNAAHAFKLGFMVGDRPARQAEVETDFKLVAQSPGGRVAGWYKQFTRCRLAEGRIDGILVDDIAAHEAEIRAKLPAFDSWPDPVQEAVFDIGFNCGIGGLLQFKHMLGAIAARDWAAAAAACHRQGIADERNQEIAALFLAARKEAVAA